VQPVLNNTQTAENNFQSVIMQMLGSAGNKNISETAAIIETNPQLKSALFNITAILNINGEIESTAKASTEQVLNNPVVAAAVKNYNLNPEQALTLAEAVKATAAVMLEAPAQRANVTKENVLLNENGVMERTPAFINTACAGKINAENNPPKADTSIPENKPAIAMPAEYKAAMPVTVNRTPVAPQNLVDNAINANNADLKTGSHVPAVRPESHVSAAQEKLETLVNELNATVKEFAELIMLADKTNGEDKAAVDLIHAKIEIINESISRLKAELAENAALPAKLAAEASVILASMSDVASRIQNSFSAADKLPADGLKIGNGDTDKGSRQGNDFSAAKQIYVNASETEDITGLMTKIYGLLRKMNGELQMANQTYYVFKPNSSMTSQVSKDGSLLINVAPLNSPAPSSFKAIIAPAFTNAEASINTNESVNNAAVIRQTDAPKYVAPVELSAAKANNAITEGLAVQPVIKGSESSKALLDNVRPMAADREWIKAQVSAYFSVYAQKEDVQAVVNARVFEKAADFAGNVKENIVVKQVLHNIQDAVQVSNKTEIRMFLRPDNMGAVAVRLEGHDKKITGRIEVSNAEVRDILRGHVGELKTALGNAGLIVDKFEISLMNYNSGSRFYGDSGNKYEILEGGVLRNDAEELLDSAGYVSGSDRYLDFLA